MPLFELGALHHDFYLLNLRLPVTYENNRALGPIADLWLVAINQNGGFTKVWLSLKTVFFPLVIGVMIWFWRRVRLLARPPTLLESMLLGLGITLSLLNCNSKFLNFYRVTLKQIWLFSAVGVFDAGFRDAIYAAARRYEARHFLFHASLLLACICWRTPHG